MIFRFYLRGHFHFLFLVLSVCLTGTNFEMKSRCILTSPRFQYWLNMSCRSSSENFSLHFILQLLHDSFILREVSILFPVNILFTTISRCLDYICSPDHRFPFSVSWRYFWNILLRFRICQNEFGIIFFAIESLWVRVRGRDVQIVFY